MYSKRLISFMLAVLMICFLALPVQAEEFFATSNVTLVYGTNETFLIYIPSGFGFNNKKVVAEVSALDVMLEHGAVLNIGVTGNDYVDSWEVIDIVDKNKSLTYIIGTADGKDDVKNNSIILSVNAGESYDSQVSVQLYFEITDSMQPGNYNDMLTFVVDVN